MATGAVVDDWAEIKAPHADDWEEIKMDHNPAQGGHAPDNENGSFLHWGGEDLKRSAEFFKNEGEGVLNGVNPVNMVKGLIHPIDALNSIAHLPKQMWDQYESGDLEGLAHSIGSLAGGVIAGKAIPEVPGAISDIKAAANGPLGAAAKAGAKAAFPEAIKATPVLGKFATGIGKKMFDAYADAKKQQQAPPPTAAAPIPAPDPVVTPQASPAPAPAVQAPTEPAASPTPAATPAPVPVAPRIPIWQRTVQPKSLADFARGAKPEADLPAVPSYMQEAFEGDRGGTGIPQEQQARTSIVNALAPKLIQHGIKPEDLDTAEGRAQAAKIAEGIPGLSKNKEFIKSIKEYNPSDTTLDRVQTLMEQWGKFADKFGYKSLGDFKQ